MATLIGQRAAPGQRPDARSLRGETSAVADEILRGLYTRSNLHWGEVIAVSSAVNGEGRTSVSLGLATTMSHDFPDRQLLVVETDVTRPVFAADVGLERAPGLSDCIAAGRVLAAAIRPTSLANVCLMPVGEVAERSERILGSPNLKLVVDELRTGFDLVLLDAPPLLSNSDGGPVAALSDGVILVVRAGSTRVEQAEQALARVGGPRLRGVVLNGAVSSVPGWLQRLTRSDGRP
jgi:Mrp family chromosome partitioning ATPase